MEILSRFRERATAENLRKALLERLEEFGLSLRNIRGITTDQATTMVKLGRLLAESARPAPFYHQLCLAHGIHLAVRDILKVEKCQPKDGAETEKSQDESWMLVDIAQEENNGECSPLMFLVRSTHVPCQKHTCSWSEAHMFLVRRTHVPSETHTCFSPKAHMFLARNTHVPYQKHTCS